MPNLHIAIRRSQTTRLCDICGGIHENIITTNSIAWLITVKVCRNCQICAREIILLNKDLCTHAAVDARSGVFLEAGAVDMASSKTKGWETGINVGPVVVMVCNAEVAGIFGSVAVRVPDQRAFPLPDC